MSLLKKLFGSKGEKFYLEMEETATEVATEAKKQIDKVADSQPVQQAAEAITEVATEAKKQIDKVTDSQPVQQAAEATTEAVEEAKEQVQSSTRKKRPSAKKKSQNGKAPAPKAQPTPANSGASSWEQPFWVKVMYNNNNGSNGKTAESNKTFATDYLMPTVSNSRRRPGASLNKFKDMASKAKTPKG